MWYVHRTRTFISDCAKRKTRNRGRQGRDGSRQSHEYGVCTANGTTHVYTFDATCQCLSDLTTYAFTGDINDNPPLPGNHLN